MSDAQGGASRMPFVDYGLTYGREIIAKAVRRIPVVQDVLDIGCGSGCDLDIVRQAYPRARLVGIESNPELIADLAERRISAIPVDIERSPLPFPDQSFDLVIANQVLEHTKEIFWINHEIARVLRRGGHFLVGVPNVASLHNRLLLLFGRHPTQFKSYSAHVRCFSHGDLQRFYQITCPGLYRPQGFWGSQFYPFPGRVARVLSRLWPGGSFSIFLLFSKEQEYHGEILAQIRKADLQTPFFAG